MTALIVQVLGEPIPQGSLRAVGRGRLISDNSRLRPWRDPIQPALPGVTFTIAPAVRGEAVAA